jgi:amino acid transporter
MAKKKVSLWKMVLFTVCGILVLDTFVAPAAIGVSSITIWVLTAILFFIPYGLINAELGAAYPEDGGIFAWVKRAFGEFHATLVGWFYWVNVAFWMPAVFVAFSWWFQLAYAPDMSIFWGAFIAIALCWVVVYIGIRGIELSVLVTNIAAVTKMAVLVIFGVLGIVYGAQNGFANSFALKEFVPSFSDALIFAPAIVYNLLGFELISSIASEIDDPGKNIPKMTFMAGILIAGLYVFGTIGVLAATPAANVDPLDGFFYALQELSTIFGSAGPTIFRIIMGFALFTLMANMISWTLGGVEVLDAADLENRSKMLAHKNKKYGTADYSYVLMGVIATFLIVLNFALSGDANAVFWTILSFSFVVFLLPYLWLFPSFVKLRLHDSDVKRPYLVPGGTAGMWISAILGEFFIGLAIILLFTGGDLLYYLTLIIGTILTTIYGIMLYRRGEPTK